jgi:hypothetical protein
MKPARVVAGMLIAYSLFSGSISPHAARIPAAIAQPPPAAGGAGDPAPADGTLPAGADLVIPAGQEELLADMLGRGAEFPDGCRLINGQVEYRVVKARYQCPAGEVIFELAHPSRAAATAPRTDRFAITLQSGSPPDSLVPALASRIRSKEAGFEWQLIVPSAEHSSGEGHGPSGESVPWVPLAIAGLLAIATLGWVVRKRGAGKKASGGSG